MRNSSNPHPNCKSNTTSITRPGITPAFLIQNAIRAVSADEARILCGCPMSGTIIPYRALEDGKLVPILDPAPQPYHRLRKDRFTEDGKYYQPSGTSVHAHIPANMLDWQSVIDAAFCEGEFKAVSLCDPHHKYNLPAVGIPGFYGFQLGRKDGQEPKLVPELEGIMRHLRPKRILFIGDNDTAFNYQFPDAAKQLRQLLPDVELILPRISLDEPKGIDDCRQKYGSKFERFFCGLVDVAEVVNPTDTVEELALRIAIPQLEFVAKMGAVERAKTTKRIIRFAAALSGGFQIEFLRAAKKPTGLGLTDFRKQMQKCMSEVSSTGVQAVEARVRPLIVGYYAGPRGSYYSEHGAEYRTIPSREDALLSLQVEAGLTGPAPRAGTEDKLALNLIQREQRVTWAGQLAGYPAGFRQVGTKSILVTSGPTIIAGISGDATVITNLLADLMGRDAEEPYFRQQLMTLSAWLAQRRRALLNPDQHLPAPVLVLVGERDIGKDFVARQVITPLLGGRETDPFEIWTGRSPFNEAAFGSEHLLVSDPEVLPDDVRAIRQFHAAALKVVTNESRSVFEKYLPAQHLRPVQAVTITMNPSADSFALLPLASRHARDKLIMLRCHPIRNLPGSGAEERRAFLARIQAALPAFAGQLDALEVPAEFQNGRFGVAAFQNPELRVLAKVKDVAGELARMLDQLAVEAGPEGLLATAQDLHGQLGQRFGEAYLRQVADPKSLGKAFLEIRRDIPGWAERLVQEGKLLYGGQRNYANTWRIRPPAVVGS